MKKYLFIFALLLCVVSLFAQNLFSIAVKGTPEQIKAVINAGADVNTHDTIGKTALMWAAGNNPNPQVITTLLKAGAKLNARDKNGGTALMVAAFG